MTSVLVLTADQKRFKTTRCESVEAKKKKKKKAGSPCLFLPPLHHTLHLLSLEKSCPSPCCPHSDLLSSDYVEIHYEGGKPVQSKVNSSSSRD